MSRILDWLRDEKNRAVLGWIGGGLAAAIGGLWTVAAFYIDHSKEKPAPPASQKIEVHNGSVIGSGPGAMFNAPINVGPDAGEVVDKVAAAQNDRYEKILAEIARKQGVEIAPLRAVLAKLGEKDVRTEDIPKRLQSAAEELVKLRAEVDVLQHGSPALAALAKEAEALINKGDLDGASQVLTRGREAARKQREGANRDEATVLGLDARVDDLKLAYRSAAAKLAEAAGLVIGFDSGKHLEYLQMQANELYKQGDEFGENPALVEAIDVYRRCIGLAPRAEKPVDWAMIENSLGLALERLGERESGTVRLEQAVEAFRDAAKEQTRARVPLDWAMTQNNLGNALAALGIKQGNPARLEEALTAFQGALEEHTRERVPLDWAMIQNNRGTALLALGLQEKEDVRFEAAAAAFREALREFTPDRVPLDWAASSGGERLALLVLALRRGEPEQMKNAMKQIEIATAALREGGHAPLGIGFEAILENMAPLLSPSANQ